ncbi:MAG TPA: permease [Rhodospirillales bacterium]|nr:permease [Rhodospirillales bacterium]
MPFEWRTDGRTLLLLTAAFFAALWVPFDAPRFEGSLHEAFALLQWYAREHVVSCLLPALMIAGAIAVFISQGSVIRLLGSEANKVAAYGTASVSGTILAVCSCTVLPLFGGLYRRGAGLGPAIAFLYSGPAINILAIVLTAKVLGFELGFARAVGAVAFSILIGLAMAALYRREERERKAAAASAALVLPDDGHAFRPAAVAMLFALMIAFLVFANWAPAEAEDSAVWHAISAWKWPLAAVSAAGVMLVLVLGFAFPRWRIGLVAAAVAALAIALPQQPQVAIAAGIVGICLVAALQPGAGREWFEQTWGFAKLILPLLLLGVLAAGFLLGRPGHEGLIPSAWVAAAVGGNSLAANAFAAVAGAFMYFATLTEIPITQALIGAGMGKGPALALLLAGPALSLPNMLVIRGFLGTEKTIVYVALVVVMATASGMIYGTFWG